ncbi:NAD(P)/FAD-dependent oxidoreductase [Pseudonocardia xishanensis]|uniref:NAD(P)/FAD-dependent oxidoreductase n=1 Tax=Pseudonocardia xishanensis TaxID=630995 RepID=A0ABP8RE34_9PSEU
MARTGAAEHSQEYDAIVVGAGWAGMYVLHRMNRLGLRTVVLERGDDVGGTWYWNGYPGARCDVPSLVYSYSFDDALQQEWTWSERYARQPEIERYAQHVADRFDLRRHIVFGTTVVSAVYDEATRTWTTTTSAGVEYRSGTVVMATGAFSTPVLPDLPGLESFEGTVVHTAQWPRAGLDVDGKRAAVVGTGSSGMQAATALARSDVAELHVVQRTPNFSVPLGNGRIDEAEVAAHKRRYAEHRAAFRRHGTIFEPILDPTSTADLDDVAFEARFREAVHVRGGLEILRMFPDLLLDAAGNERIAERLRAEIARRVRDPEVAAALTPRGYALGSRRIVVEDGYYEIFDRPNVRLVDVRRTPVEVTRDGMRTSAGTVGLDVVVAATGFDSGSGALRRIEVVGRDGVTLAQRWAAGPRTYLGLTVHGFPNLFVLAGPGSPSIRSQMMDSIEQHVEWLVELLAHMRERELHVVECGRAAEDAWTDAVAEAAAATLLVRDETQYVGANVPGKPRVYAAYVGGTPRYRAICDAVAAGGYPGLRFSGASGERTSARNVAPVLEELRTPSSVGVI